jgi:hypothetical protein
MRIHKCAECGGVSQSQVDLWKCPYCDFTNHLEGTVLNKNEADREVAKAALLWWKDNGMKFKGSGGYPYDPTIVTK